METPFIMKSVSIGPKAKISIYSMSVYGYVSESELLCGEMVYVDMTI